MKSGLLIRSSHGESHFRWAMWFHEANSTTQQRSACRISTCAGYTRKAESQPTGERLRVLGGAKACPWGADTMRRDENTARRAAGQRLNAVCVQSASPACRKRRSRSQ